MGKVGLSMKSRGLICILVVEDHAETLKVMARLLAAEGYIVHAAASAEQAGALAAANQCDVLISDIQLPGQNGLDLMRDLRAKYGLKGIAVSGHASEADISAAFDAGFVRYVKKPIDFSTLMAAIDEVMK